MTIFSSLRKAGKLIALAYLAVSATSCEDNASPIGNELVSGEVQIALDSLIWNGTNQYIYRGNDSVLIECPKLQFTTEYEKAVDSRSTTNLLGRLSVPEYGDLHCSFVSRLMCTTTLPIPDSIPLSQIDSMKLVLSVPRGELTGDSLAPQQLRAYRLTKSLPTDINNTFDPTGYYDPEQPIGSKSYTLSALGMSDSIYTKLSYINVDIPMTKEMAMNTVAAYRENPSTFQWPQSFEQYFHGIYVEPSFGRGCVANIAAVNFLIYYSYKETETTTDSDGISTSNLVTRVGTVGVFESSPIVLSSNNITYNPSTYLQNLVASGIPIVTAPGGYRVKCRFPGRELLEIYHRTTSKLSVVSGLTFTLPVEEISNDYGITPPPYMLMVKTSKLAEFLASNSLPDNKDSFYGSYNSAKKQYAFSSMRQYMLDLIEKGENITDEDLEFTFIPANLTLESNSSNNNSYYYYSSSNTATSYTVTKCTPYITSPAMCRLKLDEAQTVFTYSIQQM